MRRTYRSKKDAGGGIDAKDLVSYVDAQSSVFDAFYIQNIKQKKREVSCKSSSNQNKGTSYNVKKRKYVKRILKECSTYQNKNHSDSACACLTPDKSIHVNKAPDPFDLLLKSSPGCVIKSDSRQLSGKTYSRKLSERIKKHKHIVNETTDSDKENSTGELNHTEDISDIKNYKLVVEEVDHVLPTDQDESIDNIVKQLPLFTNIHHNNSKCIKKNKSPTDFEIEDNASLPNSPLCSTPFTVKCRSKSIYRFSPILLDFNKSKNSLESQFNRISENELTTNITPEAQESVIAVNSCCEDLTFRLKHDLTVQMDMPKVRRETINENTCNSCLLTTETEPFYGFPNISGIKKKSEQNGGSNSKTSMITNNEEATTQNLSIKKSSNKEKLLCLESVDNSTLSKIESNSKNQSDIQMWDYVSLYDTCDDDKLCNNTNLSSLNNNYSTTPVVLVERMRNSLFYKYYNKKKTCVSNHNMSDLRLNNCENWSNVTNEGNFNESCYSECLQCSSTDYGACENSDLKEDNENFEPDQDLKSYLSKEEDISFVTTRRGNKVTSNSIVFIDIDSLSNSDPKSNDKPFSPSKCNTTIEETNKFYQCKNNFNTSTDKNKTNMMKKCVPKTEMEYTTSRDDSCENNNHQDFDLYTGTIKPIVLQPGKKWERSLSIYKRMTAISDSFDYSILEHESSKCKGRRYRQSVIETMEMQKYRDSFHKESHNGRRSTFTCTPGRSAFKILKENRNLSDSLRSTIVCERGFLSEDCDDTIVELSKLSIDDSVHEVTVLEKFHESGRKAYARDYVLRRCNQTDAILFDECYPDSELKNCHKIGEGVYGEVFLWRARDGQARVLKIIPIAGDVKVNGEPQKGFHEIISEIVIAMELSALRSPIAALEKLLDEGKEVDASELHSIQNATDIFNEVIAARVVRGPYPARLLDLWELFDECRGSDNDNPALLPSDQHFAVLELANAGQDLESYTFASAEQAHALLLQVALALAVGEEALQFEHRDLHWGNVLVAPTEQAWATCVVRGRVRRVARKGVRATLIDYSLSRLALRGRALFCDLAKDESLFEAVGDRQFAVYRLMRERLGRDWSRFEPHTNVLWLHYLAGKMLTALRYRRSTAKSHKLFLARLAALEARLLGYGGAAQFVLTDEEF